MPASAIASAAAHCAQSSGTDVSWVMRTLSMTAPALVPWPVVSLTKEIVALLAFATRSR
jgi:hypothetical protein